MPPNSIISNKCSFLSGSNQTSQTLYRRSQQSRVQNCNQAQHCLSQAFLAMISNLLKCLQSQDYFQSTDLSDLAPTLEFERRSSQALNFDQCYHMEVENIRFTRQQIGYCRVWIGLNLQVGLQLISMFLHSFQQVLSIYIIEVMTRVAESIDYLFRHFGNSIGAF